MPDFHFRLPLLTIVFRVLKISVLFYSIFLILPIAISFSRTRKLLFSVTLTSFLRRMSIFVSLLSIFLLFSPVQILSASAAPPGSDTAVRLSGSSHTGHPAWRLRRHPSRPCPADGFWFPTAYPARFCKEPSPCMVRTRTSPPKTAVVNGMRAVV